MTFIIGTAGHVDHGKTSLVYAMTGTDCDKLQQEKARGITIELGFAQCTLPNGTMVSIIDVPGHEKFVKQMVAGVVGMQAVLLIISAEEGIMPQTREHLDIISLLGVKRCIVVITKIDLVDSEWLELVQEQVIDMLQDTLYQGSPLVFFSAKTGEGMEELLSQLCLIQQNYNRLQIAMPFRMPIDRVFTIKGHGTVVTGSALSGTISEQSKLMLYPQEKLVKIKNIQSHNRDLKHGMAGSRTALNIQNVAVNEIERGNVIALADTLVGSLCWEVYMYCLPTSSVAIKHMGEIHFHHQTKEILAKVYCLNKKSIEPGERTICHIHFKEPMVAVAYDRAVVRTCSPLRTIAGCIVLNPLANKHSMLHRHSAQEEYNTILQLVEEHQKIQETSLQVDGTIPSHFNDYIQQMLLLRIAMTQERGLCIRDMCIISNRAQEEIEQRLRYALNRKEIIVIEERQKRYISYAVFERDVLLLRTYLEQECIKMNLHNQYPINHLYTQYGAQLSTLYIDAMIKKLVDEGFLQRNTDLLIFPHKKISFTQHQLVIQESLIQRYHNAKLTPPTVNEILQEYSISQHELLSLLHYLQSKSILVRVAEGFWFLREEVENLCEKIRIFFLNNERLTLADFKKITGGISRKYLLPLLEYLDREKITVRIGEYRVLRHI